jgi:MFS transporter, DHA2 family, multidrug resistance protein
MTTSTTPLIAVDPVVHARRWKTLAVLSLSLIVIGLDTTILNIALPTLQDEFHTSASTLQWMVDSYLLVFAGLLLVFGTLGDRFGRKLALQAGITIFGIASLGAVIAQSAAAVIAVRAAMGVGAALIMPATLSIIANVFTGEERGKAIGIWAALAALGIGLGPLAAGVLLDQFAWWSVFLVNVPVAAVALLLGIRYVPESRDPSPGAFDLPGAALSTAGFTALVFGVVEAPDDGWLSATVLVAIGVGVVLLGVFLLHERRTAEPMLDLGFFRARGFSIGTAAFSIAFFTLMGAIFAITQYLQFAHGYSAIEAGALMTPMAVGLMAGAGSSSRAVLKLGVARVLAIGLSGLAAMLALTALWTPDTGVVWLVLWFLGLTFSIAWVSAPATESVVGAVPAAKAGVASAMATVSRMVAGALGVAIIGSLISSLYTNDVEGSLHGAPGAAADSIGSANAIAAHLPPHAGSTLLATVGDAFTDAMGIGLLVAAALAALGALFVRLVPPDAAAPTRRSRYSARRSPSSCESSC